MIFFAGSNTDKLTEFKGYIGADVNFLRCDLDEVQHLDVDYISRKKCLEAYRLFRQPLFVDDTGLYIDGLGGMPGPFITWFVKSIGSEGIAALVGNNRTAILKTSIAYADKSGNVESFIGEVRGIISDKCRGDEGFGFDNIFIPNGQSATLAEMKKDEKTPFNSRAIASGKLRQALSLNRTAKPETLL